MRLNQIKNSITLLTFLCLSIFSVKAQNIIHGKVTLYQEIGMENVPVINKKTKNKVLTDSLGYFSIECNIKDKLSISINGFSKKNIKVKSLKDSINIDLIVTGEENDIQLAATNGHIKRSNVDQIIIRFNTKPPYSLGYTNIFELMANKYPEISYINGEFIMRGINSKNGPNGALIVINGILSSVGSLNSIAVAEIKNIEILTGSKAFRYGPGSSNGVIFVELNSFE